MKIFTKRNALVGFLALKAIKRKGKSKLPSRKKNGWKLPVFLVLGIVSAGILVALVALMLRRQREPEQIEGYVMAGGPERVDASSISEPEPSPVA